MDNDSWEDWTATQKAGLVAKILRGELTLKQAYERHALSPERIREWVLVYRRNVREAFDDQLAQALAAQGIDAATLAAAEFAGSVADMPVADLLQTMSLSRRDGLVTVAHHGQESRIWCVAGEIVDAESGRLTGEHAVYRVLALEQGQLQADFRPVQRVRVLHVSTPAVLLEGARRRDECAALWQRLGDRAVVYAPSPLALALDTATHLPELAVLRSFHPGCTIEEALAHSDRGDLETLQLVSRCIQQGYLTADEQLTRVRRTAPPPEPVPDALPVNSLLAHVTSQRAERPRTLGKSATALLAAAALSLFAVTFWVRSERRPPVQASTAVRGPSSAPTPAVRPPASESPLAPGAPSFAEQPLRAAPPAPAASAPPVLAPAAVGSAGSVSAPARAAAAEPPPPHRPVPKPAPGRRSASRRASQPAAPPRAASAAESAAAGSVPAAPSVQIIPEREPRIQVLE